MIEKLESAFKNAKFYMSNEFYEWRRTKDNADLILDKEEDRVLKASSYLQAMEFFK